jgi:hypothetical protein
VLTIVAFACPLHAQDVADRRFVAGVLATLAQATVPAQLPPLSDCASHPGAIDRLCQGLIATRLAEFTTSRSAATLARDLLEGVVAEQPKWPSAWYGLGVARIQAARAGVSPREGPLQPKDVPNSTGAESALIRALEVDSTFVLAAEALALASIRTDSSSRLSDRATTLRWARRLLPPSGLYGEALVEREAHHPDVAVEIWRLLLQKGGVDRGLVELQLARDLYAMGKPAEGRTHLLAGASDTAMLSRKAYREQLDLVASWAELAQWDSTPAPARFAWLRDFWALRDVRAGQPDNARLIEHYVRLENVSIEFRYTYSSTGRLRDKQLRSMPCSSFACVEHDSITTVVDYHTDEVAAVLGAKRPFREFTSTEDRLDDRGLVYIRQGMPFAAQETIDNGGYELWQYNRAGAFVYVSFSPHLPPERARYNAPYDVHDILVLGDRPGRVAPAMLIPTVAQQRAPVMRAPGIPIPISYGYYQAGFCTLKLSLCKAYRDSTPAPNPRVNCVPEGASFKLDWIGEDPHTVPETLIARTANPPLDAPFIYARERREGYWADSLVTTSDANPPPFAKLLAPAIELHALDRVPGGAPQLVIAFAIPGEQVADDKTHSGVAAYGHPIHLHAALYRSSDGRRIDFDTTATFGPRRPLLKGESLTGVVEILVPPGTYTTGLMLTQNDSSGAVVHRDGVVVPGDEPVLRVSDVVLSRAGSDIQWSSGLTTVGLNPLTTYTKGSDADIYFQLSGMTPGKNYESSFEFTRVGDDSAHTRPLTITFTQAAASDRAEVIRNLGLKSLDVGKYRITLVVRGEGKEARATGCLTIVK